MSGGTTFAGLRPPCGLLFEQAVSLRSAVSSADQTELVPPFYRFERPVSQEALACSLSFSQAGILQSS